MASGSSGRPGSGSSKGFDFGSDDILCSYDDMVNPEASNGKHSDPVTANNSTKKKYSFESVVKQYGAGTDIRMGRPAFTPTPTYNQPDESHQELIATVERTMKKYADNLLRFLEGISSRLSQLELYCYNLEKSIGEMRSDLNRENNEADTKLRSLEKHLQEVHRSVQILRDKQELAETQKELAKLQFAQKDSSQPKEEVVAPSTTDSKKPETTQEVQNQQLALALPHQINPSMSLPARSMEQHQPMLPPTQPPPQAYYQQSQQEQYLQGDPQYQRSQMQIPQPPPPQPQSHGAPSQQVHHFSSHQQQWPQQFPQQVQQQPKQSSPPAQIAPQTPAYSPYPTSQTVNPSTETFPGSMPMQVQFSAIPPPGASRQEPAGYGYAGPSRTTVQQQPPQSNMPRQPQSLTQTLQNPYGDGAYSVTGPHPTQAPRQGYMMYEGEGGRVPPHSLPPHYSQGGYPPTHASLQNPPPTRHQSPSPAMRGHPYGEMIEKFQSMGYPRDFVASVIHRMEESGQPVDFNSLLDRLNSAPQRSWSG